MNDPVRTYDELQKKLKDFSDQQSRNEGKEESLLNELQNKGFKTIEKADEWLVIAKKEFELLSYEINDLQRNANLVIERIEKR